ncbi:hypothetical protein M8C21_011547 [Ambrosia artemisiifolia]|uniref:Uncharacterized protein n=1 Tax=Ambrosia artemisiifolia TaxID=4212 RepID=A0AAD5C3H1_AMBAR|nr:hypothetical protein M8C21_011547 [Ambrosia artemisiifolia]
MLWSGTLYVNGCFSSIISFGDSIADTGNLKHLASVSDARFPCVPPYGQNFIGQSTGRCSNGRLIIDFLAESLGLPLIPPYFKIKGARSESAVALRQGVNYAVAGSTAMDSSFVEARAIGSVVINGSLGVQLAWFKNSLPSICGNTTSSGMVNVLLPLHKEYVSSVATVDYDQAAATSFFIDFASPSCRFLTPRRCLLDYCRAACRTMIRRRAAIHRRCRAALWWIFSEDYGLQDYEIMTEVLTDIEKHCKSFIGRSLILMGEIGGNDYNIPLSKGKSIDEVQSYVPLVIDTIISTINELIDMGAQTLVVPGNFPIGCFPSYLTTGVSGLSNKDGYDPITGCLTQLNEFSEYHNKMLQAKLNQVQELNPNVNVIYADYYNAAMQIYGSPAAYGFTNGALKACCGCGGPFNYNASARCGDESTILCDDPDTYVSWDGVHLTEAAYKIISMSLFQGLFTTPRFYSLCHMTSTQGTAGLVSST